MRILITGASGMLGTDLAEALSEEHEVAGIDIRKPSHRLQVTGFIKADITSKEEIIKALCDLKPDIVIHAAAYTDVDGCEENEDLADRVNGTGTQNVVLACKKCNAVMAYINTDFVFDGEKREPYLESDEPNPLSVYGKSKLEGERYISSLLDKYFIIRTSWLFGKHGKNFVDTILKLAKKEKELKVVNDQVGSPTYTKDLAYAIKRLVTDYSAPSAPEGRDFATGEEGRDLASGGRSPITDFGIYHISNSGSCSWYEFAREILQVAGRRSQVVNIKIRPISSEELNRPAKRPKFSILDNSRYIKTVGKSLRPWQEALEAYLTTSESEQADAG